MTRFLPVRTTELHFGPYRAPQVKPGYWLEDAIEGKVEVGGLTTAPIPWPRRRKTGKASLILCGDLVNAVRRESEVAVAHWWGVSVTTVWKWRKALGVGRITPGTEELYRVYKPLKLTEERAERGRVEASKPAARDKMSQTKTGVPAPPQTRAALLAAASRTKSDGWKKQASERQKGKRPAQWKTKDWTPQEIALLGQAHDREVALRTGRSLHGVRAKRRALGIQHYK